VCSYMQRFLDNKFVYVTHIALPCIKLLIVQMSKLSHLYLAALLRPTFDRM
jgi:hypothetical protein